MVTISEFAAIDLRVGKIIEVSDLEGAKKPMWKLRVDLGELGVRTIVAGIKENYPMNVLQDRSIIVVTNLDPRDIAGVMSEGMLLAGEDEHGNISLLEPDRKLPPGAKIH